MPFQVEEAGKEGRGMEGKKEKTERWEGGEERKKQCHMGTTGTSWSKNTELKVLLLCVHSITWDR